MTPQKLRFIIIGCGKIADRHAQNIIEKGALIAVCDNDEQKAIDFATKYNAEYYFSIDELLANTKNINVAAICTPNGLHAEHSIACLNAGINVLCEKPMALSNNACRLMIAAAQSTKKTLAIVKQNRFNPPIVSLKEAIDNGHMGKIFSIQVNCYWNRDDDYYTTSKWRGTKDLDGGVLFTQFSHFIDLLYWFAGEIKTARGLMSNYNHSSLTEFEDTGSVILEFLNGVIGNINYTINSYEKNMEGSITIFAERGTVKIGGAYLNKIEYQNIKGYTLVCDDETAGANDYGSYKGSMSNHHKVYDNLLNALNNKETISTSAYDGMQTVEIINKIYSNSVNVNEPLSLVEKTSL